MPVRDLGHAESWRGGLDDCHVTDAPVKWLEQPTLRRTARLHVLKDF